ncbi:DNA (cytosine-5)-methyltransferase 3B-like [Haliotis rubra]|uniref:DNA (cytosine-5)-methyltransferase 3B-like n=1 Tax=Haliotis rubra TaxID=36100 RepID=UPI001EE582B5|nr:DNA (cytosine-5)-methyltransferase 3B-like [Haliotis rubra]
MAVTESAIASFPYRHGKGVKFQHVKAAARTLPSKKCNDSPKNKGPEAVVLETKEELAQVVEVEPNYGKLVWARLCGERWWPGTVVKGTLIYLQSQKSASSWVYWFGDHKVSQVSHDKIISFSENYKAKVGNFKSKMYRKAVLEALTECCRRGGPHVNNNNDHQMLQWAEAGFPDSTTGRQVSLDPPQDCPLPGSVMGYLTEIGNDIRRKVANMDAGNKQPDENRDNAVDAVRNGQKQLEDICISCSDLHQEVVCGHPLFEGGLCSGCKAEVSDTMYAVGEDGLHSFCAVCGAGGDLFVCDSPECQRVYCRPCVEELGGEDMLQKVIAASKWHCFLCFSCTNQQDCLLRPRPNSHEMIIRFFDTGYRVQMPSLAYFSTKRPLRVLSLFDGIGSGKLTLDQLGFSVDAYYASEIDADAIIVTRCNHGNSVVHVGDVMQLDHKKLAELSPIDLLIGGSPCNDVSLANPARRGFQSGSTALLFFEYVRVRDKLQQLNSNTHLFWLYENVASMKTEFKNTMSRFLECQPALWDSSRSSCQLNEKGRFFWGNIPGMYSTPAISTFMHENVDLNSVLEQNCNRRATISKMGCVTTRTNSLKHGKHDELFPIEMEGETTGIWISEVERLFGFPPHYTDVGNMPATRRQKLLGKSWSIPIMRNLLTPLRQYFTTTTTTPAE